jgi:hypothetical protein
VVGCMGEEDLPTCKCCGGAACLLPACQLQVAYLVDSWQCCCLFCHLLHVLSPHQCCHMPTQLPCCCQGIEGGCCNLGIAVLHNHQRADLQQQKMGEMVNEGRAGRETAACFRRGC